MRDVLLGSRGANTGSKALTTTTLVPPFGASRLFLRRRVLDLPSAVTCIILRVGRRSELR